MPPIALNSFSFYFNYDYGRPSSSKSFVDNEEYACKHTFLERFCWSGNVQNHRTNVGQKSTNILKTRFQRILDLLRRLCDSFGHVSDNMSC